MSIIYFDVVLALTRHHILNTITVAPSANNALAVSSELACLLDTYVFVCHILFSFVQKYTHLLKKQVLVDK